jgi:hypothetical protein
MFRWLGALVAAASLTWFALLLITGRYYNEGPVVFRVIEDHGMHRGDIGILAFWAAGMIGLGLATWSGRRGVQRR